jgi:hypothetical protein
METHSWIEKQTDRDTQKDEEIQRDTKTNKTARLSHVPPFIFSEQGK